ncbi:MAG: DUF6580 family putative transport protein [Candidatus Kapaibacterium sp.]
MKEFRSTKFLFVLAVILLAASTRFISDIPNFNPFWAVAFFAGAMIPGRFKAIAIPLGALFISDIFLGFHADMLAVYLGFALMIFIGRVLMNKPDIYNIGGGAVLGAVLFYLITNFSSWITMGTYPMTWDGLISCYAAAIPFFRNAILSTVLFTYAFFGVNLLFEKFVIGRNLLPAKIGS